MKTILMKFNSKEGVAMDLTDLRKKAKVKVATVAVVTAVAVASTPPL